jgi:hypothetical protein
VTDCAIETSPQTYTKIGGLLYLIIIAIGRFGEAFVREKVIVSPISSSNRTVLALE